MPNLRSSSLNGLNEKQLNLTNAHMESRMKERQANLHPDFSTAVNVAGENPMVKENKYFVNIRLMRVA